MPRPQLTTTLTLAAGRGRPQSGAERERSGQPWVPVLNPMLGVSPGKSLPTLSHLPQDRNHEAFLPEPTQVVSQWREASSPEQTTGYTWDLSLGVWS